MSDWQPVIGLEVHAQITAGSKFFSSASTTFGAEPNSQVHFVDAGFPGMLPVINRRCIEAGVMTGLALNGEINRRSVFARKNYFYPDLPQGYQISQFDQPLVIGGRLAISDSRTIEITRIHLEQDAGKLLHDVSPDLSYVDLNRSGVALMEIVTEPVIVSPQEASEFVRKLRVLLRSIGVCNGNMQEGSLRVDANISVRRVGEELGTRTEVKNVNSMKFLRQAIDHEITRQREILASGGGISQETRLFDPASGKTRAMRSKEEAHDYRYFSDPDLLPVILKPAEIERLAELLPELPDKRQSRYVQQYQLAGKDAAAIAEDLQLSEYFEEMMANNAGPKEACRWLRTELMGKLNRASVEVKESRVPPIELSNLVKMVESGKITGKIAKEALSKMWDSGMGAKEVVEKYDLITITDEDTIKNMVSELLTANPKQAEAFRMGKTRVKGWFIGQIMQQSGGKADPNLVNSLIDQQLKAKFD